MTAPVVLWFRQDLRLDDHPALAAALASGRPVIPIYVLDDDAAGKWAPGGASRWWLHESLRALAASLRERGANLVLRRGRAATEIARLIGESGAGEVFTGQLVEPWARQQDKDVAKAITPLGTRLQQSLTTLIFDPAKIRTRTGGVYGVFTPYARACRAAPPLPPPLPAPAHFSPGPALASDRLEDWNLPPRHPDWSGGLRAIWAPGETGAKARLAALADRLPAYAARRDFPGEDSTSMLSPHLHFGEISPLRAWHAGAASERFRDELLWREFSAYLLCHHPELPERSLRPEFERFPWRSDPPALRAWQNGRTGLPIVDAGMRQLWHTGWMHNRVRMVVASFLIKHLLLPWQEGEAWFWDTLVDADLAANAASWQWVAGSGTDAAPFFRIFNPILQARKFDPGGAYVRAWLPELARVPANHVHAPWEFSDRFRPPIVDLAQGRARALAAFHTLGRDAA